LACTDFAGVARVFVGGPRTNPAARTYSSTPGHPFSFLRRSQVSRLFSNSAQSSAATRKYFARLLLTKKTASADCFYRSQQLNCI